MNLNRTKRRIIGTLFFLLFLISAPAIIFYATGNKVGESWSILQTGGLYLRSIPSGSTIYIDSKLNKITGYFGRDVLIKNLHPGVYEVSINKDEYNSWSKKITVYGNVVSDSRVLMLPKEIKTTEIKKFIESEILGSSTKPVVQELNPDYSIVTTLFLATTTPAKSILKTGPLGTAKNPITNRNLELWRDGGDILIKWVGKLDSIPDIFCIEDVCDSIIKIHSFDSPVSNVDFFPGDSEVVLVAVADKVYALESETNPAKIPQIIYSGQKPDFRVVDNSVIYIKDVDFYGQVEI